jgi:thiol-disulfide isomerase/thioredoxin
MKTKIYILILVLSFPLGMNSQISDTIYKISLESAVREPYSGTLWEVQIVEDYSFLKNIPDIECDLHAINNFKLNQYIGKDSIRNQMYLFVGVNEKKKEKYVVVDANNNHDFSDDKLHTFSLPEEPLTRDEKKKRAIGIEITLDVNKNLFANIGIDPFNYYEYKYGLPQDERLEVIIIFTDYMEAQAQIEDIPVEIYADCSPNLFQKELDSRTYFSIFYNDKAGKPSNKDFKVGDSIHINDKLLLFSKIEYPDIYLEPVGILADSSSVGSFIPEVYAKNRETHNDMRINDLAKDKYVFIDFWGSWCSPCIVSIPKLKDFYEKIKDRNDVLMLGIAKEYDRKDLDKLKRIISEKGIEWLNLWLSGEDGKISTSILNKLNIKAYPTYLIIDNKGKIVYKEQSMYKTEEAANFFLDMIYK